MRIHISHETVYRYERPVGGVTQLLRKTPRNHNGQYVVNWRIDVSESEELKIVHGNSIRGEGSAEFARIFNKRGQFVAVASVENGWVHPRLVLTSVTSD